MAPSTLRRISAEEFARRLKGTTGEIDKRYAFFLGAGCSVSSGIPTATTLVRDVWLPKLRDLKAPNRPDLEAWAKEEIPDYDPTKPAASYGAVMEKLFLQPEERQREVERLCSDTFPDFGYACLSSLMASPEGCFNVVLTTNFDDLVADALYLFTKARPLVIQHESLAGFIRPTRTRPLVVKIHGDHRLSPMNTSQETETIKEGIDKHVGSLLHDRGLVFVGYGGNDQGIAKMLEKLPVEALPLGVCWVGEREPDGVIRPWLEKRQAVWVEKKDFDELMLLVRNVFDLPHPDRKRFEDVFEKYKKTYEKLSGRVLSLQPTAPDAAALKEAVTRADRSFPSWWAVELAASRLSRSDPDKADEIYRKGMAEFSNEPSLMNNYAIFLKNVRKDYDRAEEFYRKAIDADPKDADILDNYAIFLKNARKDYDRAEEFYLKAMDADPKDANILGNYANFLTDIRKDHDKAERFYRKAIDADPNDANILDNYANFLTLVRKDHARAEELYRKALGTDPKDANRMANFAGFLLGQGKTAEGTAMLNRAIALLETTSREDTNIEVWFYALANGPTERRQEAIKNLKRALTAGAKSPDWDFSANIEKARKDGHPDIKWLEKVADVISHGADLATLNGWKAWQSA